MKSNTFLSTLSIELLISQRPLRSPCKDNYCNDTKCQNISFVYLYEK